MTTTTAALPLGVFSNPAYAGKHVVVVNGEVFAATTGEEAVRILEEVRKKYPDKQPILGYVPEAEALILIVWR